MCTINVPFGIEGKSNVEPNYIFDDVSTFKDTLLFAKYMDVNTFVLQKKYYSSYTTDFWNGYSTYSLNALSSDKIVKLETLKVDDYSWVMIVATPTQIKQISYSIEGENYTHSVITLTNSNYQFTDIKDIVLVKGTKLYINDNNERLFYIDYYNNCIINGSTELNEQLIYDVNLKNVMNQYATYPDINLNRFIVNRIPGSNIVFGFSQFGYIYKFSYPFSLDRIKKEYDDSDYLNDFVNGYALTLNKDENIEFLLRSDSGEYVVYTYDAKGIRKSYVLDENDLIFDTGIIDVIYNDYKRIGVLLNSGEVISIERFINTESLNNDILSVPSNTVINSFYVDEENDTYTANTYSLTDNTYGFISDGFTDNPELSSVMNEIATQVNSPLTIRKIGNDTFMLYENCGKKYSSLVYILNTETDTYDVIDLDKSYSKYSVVSNIRFDSSTGKIYICYGDRILELNGANITEIPIYADLTDTNTDYPLLYSLSKMSSYDISFPDDNTVLVANSKGVYQIHNDFKLNKLTVSDNTAHLEEYSFNEPVLKLNGFVIFDSRQNKNTNSCFVLGKNNGVIYKINEADKDKHMVEFLDIRKSGYPDNTNVVDILEYPTENIKYVVATDKGICCIGEQNRLYDCFNEPLTLNQLNSILNEELAKIIKKHESSDLHMNNNLALADMSFISTDSCGTDLLSVPSETAMRAIENDCIVSIAYDNSNVKVGFTNDALQSGTIYTGAIYSSDGYVDGFTDPVSEDEVSVRDVTTIVKTWKSGIKEFYIYVPSTGTYYINSPYGINNSKTGYQSYERDNIPDYSVQNALNLTYTQLRVYLYNSNFNISRIHMAEICGNSLPLKVYSDMVNSTFSETSATKGYYDSVILPSSVSSVLSSTSENGTVNNINNLLDENGRICIDFSICGTDAQSIHIIAE